MKNKLNKKTIENLAQIAELRKKNAYLDGEFFGLSILATTAIGTAIAVVAKKCRKEEENEEEIG